MLNRRERADAGFTASFLHNLNHVYTGHPPGCPDLLSSALQGIRKYAAYRNKSLLSP